MDAVTPTSASLEAQGLRVTVATDGTLAVTMTVPRSLGPIVRAALAWRQAAMQAAWDRRGPRPAWQCPALAARPETARPETARRTGHCPSCAEAHACQGNGGDCYLCIAARIAVLKGVGAVGCSVTGAA